MKKVGILTLGCRVNQYESDAIAELFVKRGVEITSFDERCDLRIINTCTVTAESDSKCRKLIRRAVRLRDEDGGRVAVIGCFPQGAREEYDELLMADFLSGNRNKLEIVSHFDEILSGKRLDLRRDLDGAEYENMSIDSCKYVKAYLKIEDGCNNFCSYCYVPFVRGRVRSRAKSEVVAEVKRLVKSGYSEIILTGIETSSYGEDFEEDEPLVALVEEIAEIAPTLRLRFGSLHPTFFSEDRLKRLRASGIVMPHFHLSVQSASGSVLKKMGRGYGEDELYSAVEGIRKYFPDANLSCDMICGFPEESDEDFEKSLDFIRRAEILHTHIFPYSKREGTRAAQMPEVATDVKYERARIMKRVAEECHEKAAEKSIGKHFRVLVEFFRGGVGFGYTENFINVTFEKKENMKKGDIITLELTKEMIR